mgnify:CR=1 FL=1
MNCALPSFPMPVELAAFLGAPMNRPSASGALAHHPRVKRKALALWLNRMIIFRRL